MFDNGHPCLVTSKLRQGKGARPAQTRTFADENILLRERLMELLSSVLDKVKLIVSDSVVPAVPSSQFLAEARILALFNARVVCSVRARLSPQRNGSVASPSTGLCPNLSNDSRHSSRSALQVFQDSKCTLVPKCSSFRQKHGNHMVPRKWNASGILACS